MRKFIIILSSCFGIGYIPFASGTFASLFAILPYLLIARYNNVKSLLVYLLLVFVFSLIAIWVSNEAEKIFNEKDSHKIVIDEVAGFFLSMVLLPAYNFKYYIIAAFFLFRIYDVWKPYPIRSSQELKGGLGVVADDLIAGFYACFTIHIFVFLNYVLGGMLWML